jgi:hypothetical protein
LILASFLVRWPNIIHFTVRRIMKMVYEGQDRAVPTYSYHFNAFRNCYAPIAGIASTYGYPVPGATQMTNPMKYSPTRGLIPNPDPDGTFKPSSEDATYVMMKNPDTGALEPQYVEDHVDSFTFKPKNICSAGQ